jgi:hypothetical protein
MSVDAWQNWWSQEGKGEVVDLLALHWRPVEPHQPALSSAYTSQAELVGQRLRAGCTATQLTEDFAAAGRDLGGPPNPERDARVVQVIFAWYAEKVRTPDWL